MYDAKFNRMIKKDPKVFDTEYDFHPVGELTPTQEASLPEHIQKLLRGKAEAEQKS